ncbi:MAG TPA: hypothetical protein VHW66_22375 [Stellaceae bacterium]|jgi:hypothetical protein|nr:hypothetical protein [Stellaceae bacterium]
MADAEQRDPERVGRDGEKLTWEAAKGAELRRQEVEREAELRRQEIERADKAEIQRLALRDILFGDQRAGKAALEIEEHRKLIEEEHRQQRDDLLQKQQERMDRLELLFRGPPSEREK